ncbi:SDR family oxidoreductase [Devosia neptuniae]|jgi:NAD(P)-dependent dehydrogenase (short-subunit alcohol dehydrogenase family)|uniref:SDR family oxidoreductase n=1 Tax=Devosia TaxID=46913 RepID=UPI0022AF5A92|nr:SDR family oxidoreductase [Devosia neptuniae]MCZ4346410.1 SDR family oxidoreductase [Devosia neptuniae]|tara:strand:- start:70213 stop:70968 length:756 start_codon:yes stop_codon:yes gene_type:complete
MRLKDKIAIITGAGRGIGAAIAEAFVREGAEVVIAEQDAETGSATATRLGAWFVPTDVTDQKSVDLLVAAVVAKYGRIDILVNNAGINVFHDPLETSDAEWARCMAVDLEGVWRLCRAVLPTMLANQAGSIVNISSSHSTSIIPGSFPYPVAKHGLLGLTRALGIEYAARNIRVNAIAPGYIETQLAIDYWASFPDPAAERQRTYDLHPPKRIGRPEEVAMTAVFLASDEAPFINATSIAIDGGRSVLYHE